MRLNTWITMMVATVGVGCAQKGKSVQPAAVPAGPAASVPAAAGTTQTPAVAVKVAEPNCTRASEFRLLKLEAIKPKGCKLWYPSATREVASSSQGTAHCEKIRDQIRKNLEEAGFKCPNDK